MKWAFQLAIYERAKRDDRIHLIIGDIGATMFAKFRADFPGRFFNAGLCEQSMISMAAGMAIAGLRPIIYSITPFLLERAFEQIKLDVMQMNLPVGLVGFSDEFNGPTHKELNAFDTARLFRGPSDEGIDYRFPNTGADVTSMIERMNLDHPWIMFLKPASE